jgi:hypothetical protein
MINLSGRTLAVFLLLVSVSYSQTRTKESLRGLTGIFVYVLPVGKEVETGGLSRTQIQKAVQKQLSEAGVTLYNEPQSAEGSANLAITVDTVKYSQEAFLYTVDVELLQDVHLARRSDPEPFPAQTWAAKALGITGAHRMDLMLEPLKARLADFVADYLAVNPKTLPPK